MGLRVDEEMRRLVWTVDGEDVTKQSFPVGITSYPPELLVAEMDNADIDVALIQSDPMLVRGSEYLGECVRRFPSRLRALMPVDEWRVVAETDAVVAEVVRGITELGLSGVKYIAPNSYLGSEASWDGPPYDRLWSAVADLGVPVFMQMGASQVRPTPPTIEREVYAAEVERLRHWLQRYPSIPLIVTHGLPWRTCWDGLSFTIPDCLLSLFDAPNAHLEIVVPARVGDFLEYPYTPAASMVAALATRLGADRLLWGSDAPFQSRSCTYVQGRRWIEQSGAPSQDDLRMLMGGTAARILGLGQ